MIEFVSLVWYKFLYIPLINVLVWLYNGAAGENIVWAVILLTVILRTLLLPLSIISERNKVRYRKLGEKFDQINKKFKGDPVERKNQIRKLLRQNKFSPWAKAVVLGIQVLVFVLLYQVFLGGVKGKVSLSILYSWVDFPVFINTQFYGFNASERSIFWAAVVGGFLLLQVLLEQRRRRDGLTKKDLYYTILFPGSVFIFLLLLPMVKSIFLLTTILYSAIISSFGRMVSPKPK